MGNLTNDNDATSLSVAGAAVACAQVTGIWSGTLNFEASPDGGTTWYAAQVIAYGTTSIGTTTTANGLYLANVSAMETFRVRLHPVVSGTAVVSLRSSGATILEAFANATALGQATSANSAPVVIASDQSTLPVQGAFTTVTGGAGVTGTNTFAIPATDLATYKYISLQLAGTWSATLVWEWSNDNVNWNGGVLNQINAYSANNNVGSTTFNQMWVGAVQGRYFRVRASAYASNASMAATLIAWTVAPSQYVYAVNSTPTPTTAGGNSVARIQSAASTNATSVKASGGQLYSFHFGNNGASDAWVKLYNKASAPTVGTDTPIATIYVPKGGVATWSDTLGEAYGTGIAYAITGGAADSDTTAVAANQVTGKITYK